jgi:hypothetical protein
MARGVWWQPSDAPKKINGRVTIAIVVCSGEEFSACAAAPPPTLPLP